MLKYTPLEKALKQVPREPSRVLPKSRHPKIHGVFIVLPSRLPGEPPSPFHPLPSVRQQGYHQISKGGTRHGIRYYKCRFFSTWRCNFFKWREGYAGLLKGNGGPPGACSCAASPAQNYTKIWRAKIMLCPSPTPWPHRAGTLTHLASWILDDPVRRWRRGQKKTIFLHKF